jgi:hydrogenase/urease accessory protein HupE
MKRHLKCLSSLAIAAAGIPVTALGHPGHAHDAGTLAAVNHAAIGLDQLLIVFAVAAVGAYAIKRLRR